MDRLAKSLLMNCKFLYCFFFFLCHPFLQLITLLHLHCLSLPFPMFVFPVKIGCNDLIFHDYFEKLFILYNGNYNLSHMVKGISLFFCEFLLYNLILYAISFKSTCFSQIRFYTCS